MSQEEAERISDLYYPDQKLMVVGDRWNRVDSPSKILTHDFVPPLLPVREGDFALFP